jgi:hypothetical protein
VTGKPLAAGLALLALAVAGATTAYAVTGSAQAGPLLDIEIAIDATSSMGASIAQAQADSKRLVDQVQKRYPGALFAVVQFRDSTDEPEYQLLQPMTDQDDKVDAAIDKISPAGGQDYPEAYNLVFQNSTSDSAIGWRSKSRKLVVVIGDAEPHGAGSAGFAGCADTTGDPHELNTATVLAAMKAAQRTLIMVRQAATASTSLECYESLAAGGFNGGAARNGGDDIISVIADLIDVAATTPTTTGSTTGTGTTTGTTATTTTTTTPTTTTRPTTTTGTLPPVPPPGKEIVVPTGRVLIKVNGVFVPLTAGRVVPYGTELDTTKGRVRLTSRDGSAGTFKEAVFKLVPELDTIVPGQPAKRVTTLLLTGGDFKKCKARKTAGAAQGPKRRTPVRHVWGSAKGEFRTKGRFAAATVRGTIWLTTDFCDGTNIRVLRGKLDVFDRVKRRHFLIPAGKSYFAPLGRVRPGG